ncbi:SusC/RagA family TonB-linked outer membrane protein [Elizabethkingia anophelis]|uniref:SusC/RagA family TonB-linked outer membrane protein n=1 Tax=Elizabethkingia anophelis TaxID=1117645 RepID=UPI002011DEAB|nr:SusC/RagA family TonB-linked outer membrane protein [Elizabethkingia anophelis]MCL1688663.1 SusC/RagA family TonB-linked outer membrane protein [Elizabethkingia anophelis]MDV3575404.1 SusC/RagA family TonB-linked outer membrane protein [Elizabethkingia anophelis]MDV3599605.1 SusC/RagA family TonB-linked outer membrane protein [Elizabethkingia anophelis]MDV3606465.1 SusC/RagA family TonB-linked outer membrane protein [Elizabethkingia anophelis]MDV3639785.1 SusC/RagA family TonB-linked outer 
MKVNYKVFTASLFFMGVYVYSQKKDTLLKENKIDEVIVVGYGKSTKSKMTDNVAKISAESIKEIPNANFQNALVGKAAGVQINQTNGKLEAGFNINIRGSASISAGTGPLYVIDGIPLINRDESTNSAPVNPLVTLSASEIESVEILKDASSAAIYGSRGSNGVVLITTKTGKKGKPKLSFNISQGFSNPTHKVRFLNAKEYVELLLEAGRNVNDEDFVIRRFNRYSNNTDWRNGAIDTDWQKYIFRQGAVRDADFSVSGGDDNYNYMFTASNNDSKGIIRGNDLGRNTARLNVSAKVTDKLKLGMNLGFSRTSIDRVANDNAFVTPMQAVAQAPISPAFIDGEPFTGTTYANFLLEDKYANYNTLIKRLTGKLSAEYKILKNLTFNSDLGYDYYNQKEKNYRGRNTPQMATDGYAYNSWVDTENLVFTNYLSYNLRFGSNNISAVAGTEYNKNRREFGSVTGIRFPSDDFQNINSAGEIIEGRGEASEYTFFSYFARVNYDYKGKYLLKGSIRRDGSSRFGQENRYGVFPAFSAGWVISKESFLSESNTISLLKLRASWGKTGNAEIGDFAARDQWQATKYKQLPGIEPIQPANPDLTWEKSTQTDIGLDFGLFSNRISGEIDLYNKKTNGLLFQQNIPYTSGYSSIYRNIGDMSNKGFEIVLNTQNFRRGNFTWNTSFNIARNNNKITALPDNNADQIIGNTILRVGERLASFYLTEYAGVDPANGDALYYKNTLKSDGTLDKTTTNQYSEANRIVAGSFTPLWIGGLTNTLEYKNFDFSFTLYGEFGASIYNSGGKFMSTAGSWFDNQTADQMNRWQKPGDITNVPQARLGEENGTQESTRYLEKRDFVRLRNFSLGYTLNKDLMKSLGVNKLRIYISAINLLTFTKYSGYDPEALADTGRGGGGATFYSAPPARTFTFGLNVNF